MGSRLRPVILAVACLTAMPLAARADVVELTNGARIVGKVMDATATEIVVKVAGRDMRVRQDRVRAITFDEDKRVPVAKVAVAPPPEPVAPARPLQPVPPAVAAAVVLLDRLQAATAKPISPA